MVIIVAILALVVVNALAESPWGVFSVGMTIPIALFMGVYLRFIRPGKIMEVSLIGFVLLMAAIIGGGVVAATEWGDALFTLDKVTLAWAIIIYGFVAAILPVWLLLAPRDYLSTFMKIGVIVMLALAVIVVRPEITVPAFSEFASRDNGPVFPGALFPFLFVTIACGALSGFHALIASGTTPKLIEKERQTRYIGYGGMLMESFVAIMALVAAISIDRGLYFAMNSPAALTGGTVETAAAWVNSLGLSGVNISPEHARRDGCQRRRGEHRLPHRRRPDPGRGPCPHHAAVHRRHRHDELLVPLRHHVRGAVHPHRGRRRHARCPLHAAGLDRQLRPEVQGALLASRRLALHRQSWSVPGAPCC